MAKKAKVAKVAKVASVKTRTNLKMEEFVDVWQAGGGSLATVQETLNKRGFNLKEDTIRLKYYTAKKKLVTLGVELVPIQGGGRGGKSTDWASIASKYATPAKAGVPEPPPGVEVPPTE